MDGTLVWKRSLTTTAPLRANSTPISSMPSPRVLGSRPVANITASVSSVCPSFSVAIRVLPSRSMRAMSASNRRSMPFLRISAARVFRTSMSKPRMNSGPR